MNTDKTRRPGLGATRRGGPLRVAVLCSHRAPGLDHLLERDQNRGVLYDIVCCLTAEETFADREVVMSHGIPLVVHSMRSFCHEHGYSVSDRTGRAAYDTATTIKLQPYQPDVIVLASYLYLLTAPMLATFPNRIVNVHHSDLTRRDAAGRALFPGLRAVRDAILAGERETRATVHVVTTELDQGPPLLRSWAFPVSPLADFALASSAKDVLKAYVFAHQEWMIRATWGPLLASAIELIATGRFDLARLAVMAPDRLGLPWDLDERATVIGGGPLAVGLSLMVGSR
jgi:folate-dependent phosphoribosylglycinamide formyltransferase PurN